MPPPEQCKQSEMGSKPTPCQPHTGTYVLILASENADYLAFHPEQTATYMLRVVSITTHTHDNLRSLGKESEKDETKTKIIM